ASVDIAKADATIHITPYTGVYDGKAHGLAGTATGVLGEDLSSLLHLGPTAVHPGHYDVNWSFDGNTNYKSAGDTSTVDIAMADAHISINPFSGVYDGQAHGLTGSATGVQGEDLSTLLDLGASQVHAGHYDVTWSFAGNTDYNSATASSTIDIAKADATISVNPFSGIYDGQAHSLTGSATGVQGEDLNGLLDLGASFRNVGHDAVSWSFAGTADYNSAAG